MAMTSHHAEYPLHICIYIYAYICVIYLFHVCPSALKDVLKFEVLLDLLILTAKPKQLLESKLKNRIPTAKAIMHCLTELVFQSDRNALFLLCLVRMITLLNHTDNRFRQPYSIQFSRPRDIPQFVNITWFGYIPCELLMYFVEMKWSSHAVPRHSPKGNLFKHAI